MNNKSPSALLILLLFISSCSLFDGKEEIRPAADNKPVVFYADTTRIYSSGITGSNQKLLLDLYKPGQSRALYGGALSLLPDSNKIIFAYSANSKNYLSILNEDGTNQKDLLQLPAQANIWFKGIKAGKIYYNLSTSAGAEHWLMNSDGTGNQKLNFPATSFGPFGDASMSNDGRGFLTGTVAGSKQENRTVRTIYFQPMVNWTADLSKRWLVTTLTTPFSYSPPGPPIIPDDATKMAYLSRAANGNYDVLVRDLTSQNGATQTVYTYPYPTSGPGAIATPHIPSLFWVGGSSKLFITYGNFAAAGGIGPDYTYCVVVDPATGQSTNWKIEGHGVLRMVVK